MFALLRISLFVFIFVSFTSFALACGSCGIAIADFGEERSLLQSESQDKKVYFQYLFNQVHYDKMDARDAQLIHHAGHHVHDKTSEDFHHFKLGSHITRKFNVSLEIPYAIKHSLEVDDHDFLGDKQTSQGWGDLRLMNEYIFWEDSSQAIRGIAGIQFPTGHTRAKTTAGELFEPEMQPGLGAFGYMAGGRYQKRLLRSDISATGTYLFMTRGEHEYEGGDVLRLSAQYDHTLNPGWEHLKTSLGLDAVYQYETEDKTDGVKNPDSGGHLILAGPVIKVRATDRVSILSSVLFPVYQQLGGVHQEMAYEWTLGAQIAW